METREAMTTLLQQLCIDFATGCFDIHVWECISMSPGAVRDCRKCGSVKYACYIEECLHQIGDAVFFACGNERDRWVLGWIDLWSTIGPMTICGCSLGIVGESHASWSAFCIELIHA
jgi:hypothetical protein